MACAFVPGLGWRQQRLPCALARADGSTPHACGRKARGHTRINGTASRAVRLCASAAQQETDVQNPECDPQWMQAAQILTSDLGLSEDDARKALRRGFGWTSQVYWKKRRVQDIPEPDMIKENVAYVQTELQLDASKMARVVSAYPEFLGLDLEKRIKPNLDKIRTEFKLTGMRLKNSVLENPDCLGYDFDCAAMGESCLGECARCWVRF
ncbi:hypothetical protein FVE85_6925 [Porphyridium purpureum]|uniref:Uncharacterized protein n=1 Tax=Porphyridium purpureum TaxID=35688 RepID=A0A5J4Z8B9_PORPP|nr:hypothetical protein FVE85_6925 [Porphyridium purpureum]|eukprot:POR3243..scf295_1